MHSKSWEKKDIVGQDLLWMLLLVQNQLVDHMNIKPAAISYWVTLFILNGNHLTKEETLADWSALVSNMHPKNSMAVLRMRFQEWDFTFK